MKRTEKGGGESNDLSCRSSLKLNTDNHVISFSGGLSSATTVLEVLALHPHAEVVFMDTGAEHPKTYSFIRDFSRAYGVTITCLRGVPNPAMGKGVDYEVVSLDGIGPDLIPWAKMVAKYGHPYVGGAFCTDRMKKRPFEKYCDDRYGKNNYVRWIGIRADEPRRLIRKEGYRYLADVCPMTRVEIKSWWERQPVNLDLPEHLVNCVFCIKKSEKKLSAALHDEPEMSAEFISMLDRHDIKDNRIMYRGKRTLIDMFTLTPGDEGVSLDLVPECGEECGILTETSDISIAEVGGGCTAITYDNKDYIIRPSGRGFILGALDPERPADLGRFSSLEDCLEYIQSSWRIMNHDS